MTDYITTLATHLEPLLPTGTGTTTLPQGPLCDALMKAEAAEPSKSARAKSAAVALLHESGGKVQARREGADVTFTLTNHEGTTFSAGSADSPGDVDSAAERAARGFDGMMELALLMGFQFTN